MISHGRARKFKQILARIFKKENSCSALMSPLSKYSNNKKEQIKGNIKKLYLQARCLAMAILPAPARSWSKTGGGREREITIFSAVRCIGLAGCSEECRKWESFNSLRCDCGQKLPSSTHSPLPSSLPEKKDAGILNQNSSKQEIFRKP